MYDLGSRLTFYHQLQCVLTNLKQRSPQKLIVHLLPSIEKRFKMKQRMIAQMLIYMKQIYVHKMFSSSEFQLQTYHSVN